SIFSCHCTSEVYENSSSASSSDEEFSVIYENSEFPKRSEVQYTKISNGSLLSFADHGLIQGKIVRAAQSFNNVPNPLGVTHSAFAYCEKPTYIFNNIVKVMETKGTSLNARNDFGTQMCNEIAECYPQVKATHVDLSYDIAEAFCAEATGSAKEIITGTLPHFRVRPLQTIITGHNGAVYLRSLNKAIPIETTREFVSTHLGTYHELVNPLSVWKATNGDNSVDDKTALLCSEVVARLLLDSGVFAPEEFKIKMEAIGANPIPDNVLPEFLLTTAEKYDLLENKAGLEITLKQKENSNVFVSIYRSFKNCKK
ncbi:MAG: hypothetical protein LBP31_03240, partial [Holosporales bacterium]|nr:hypothetical protein [Holosporales bacterium]